MSTRTYSSIRGGRTIPFEPLLDPPTWRVFFFFFFPFLFSFFLLFFHSLEMGIKTQRARATDSCTSRFSEIDRARLSLRPEPPHNRLHFPVRRLSPRSSVTFGVCHFRHGISPESNSPVHWHVLDAMRDARHGKTYWGTRSSQRKFLTNTHFLPLRQTNFLVDCNKLTEFLCCINRNPVQSTEKFVCPYSNEDLIRSTFALYLCVSYSSNLVRKFSSRLRTHLRDPFGWINWNSWEPNLLVEREQILLLTKKNGWILLLYRAKILFNRLKYLFVRVQTRI